MLESGIDLVVRVLTNSGDGRGASFPLPATWLGELNGALDVHITTLVPGATRGDHYHRARRELLIVLHRGAWSLHWDCGQDTEVRRRDFAGAGAVLIEVAPFAAHAVRNDGTTELSIVGLSEGAFDPVAPDSYPRKVSRP